MITPVVAGSYIQFKTWVRKTTAGSFSYVNRAEQLQGLDYGIVVLLVGEWTHHKDWNNIRDLAAIRGCVFATPINDNKIRLQK